MLADYRNANPRFADNHERTSGADLISIPETVRPIALASSGGVILPSHWPLRITSRLSFLPSG
jgi:hypothetical protein